VDSIHTEGSWPILVGGTHFYVQSLLFKNSILSTPEETEIEHHILSASSEELFRSLKEVDPAQAARLHPSDRRKVQNKMKLYLRTGRPASELFKEQKQGGIQPRWDILIFWVWSDRNVLNQRLDERVDKMVALGIEDECRKLYQVAQQNKLPITSGIFQAIGYFPH
jgi:tRNA dimethylallyltransferase